MKIFKVKKKKVKICSTEGKIKRICKLYANYDVQNCEVSQSQGFGDIDIESRTILLERITSDLMESV